MRDRLLPVTSAQHESQQYRAENRDMMMDPMQPVRDEKNANI